MIEKFLSLSTVGVPLDRGNVDTDAIIPARYLKTLKRTGWASGSSSRGGTTWTGRSDPIFR